MTAPGYVIYRGTTRDAWREDDGEVTYRNTGGEAVLAGRKVAATFLPLEPSAPAVDYSWADEPAPEPHPLVWTADEPDASPVDVLGHYMAETEAALSSLTTSLPAALDAMPLQDTSVLDLIAWAQAQRRVLLELERAATVYAGQNLRVEHRGTMRDGRTYDLHRAVDRKAWDRDAWTRDARHAVIAEAVPQGLAVLDPATGGVGETARHLAQRVAAAVQEVHGSGPPRVTAMRRLGLNPDEYAETVPGSWTVRFTDPIPTTEA